MCCGGKNRRSSSTRSATGCSISALTGTLVLHQLERGQEERLELGHLRDDARPAHDVIRAQERQSLAEGIGQILLLLALQKCPTRR